MSGENRIQPESSRKATLRERMIRKTQENIDEHLGDREVPWPRRHESGDHGRDNGEILGRAAPSTAMQSVRVIRSDRAACLIEFQANNQGYLDEARVRELEARLHELIGPGQRGDVVIDLAQVRSLNSRFLSVVEYARKRLHDQRRRIVLFGLQPHCADVLRANKLKPTVECYATEQQALKTLAAR